MRSKQLFKEYWGRPGATAEAFDPVGGFFRTGDTAVLEGDPPAYRLMGRTSVDIIKRGGHKLSALQIEDALLSHPRVKECAVVGLPDEDYGEVGAELGALWGMTTFRVFF